MSLTSGANVEAQLRWRYATKKFDPLRKISERDWQHLEQSLVLTPSSFGLQPWKFFVVTNAALKNQMPAISWRQTQPAECSHMVVFAIRKNMAEDHIERFVTRTAEVRGITPESLAGFKKMMMGSLLRDGFAINEWATNQVYIALGQFMACAAMMGIDTCPMEGIENAKYDELLGIPEHGYVTSVACAVGYRADDDKYAALPKVRFNSHDVVHVIGD